MKHILITKTYKKQRVSIRCPILVYHKKHTGHEGYQSESIGAMQYQINESPTQIKIELLTTSEKSISIRKEKKN
jgi:hypothetical protein